MLPVAPHSSYRLWSVVTVWIGLAVTSMLLLPVAVHAATASGVKPGVASPTPSRIVRAAPQKSGGARVRARIAAPVTPAKPSYGQMAGLHAVQDPLDLKSSVALVVDQETREARTLALPSGTALIARHPLRIVPQPSGDATTQVGQVQLAAGGAQLSFPGMPERAPIVLHPAQRYELAGGAVVLRYRGPAPSTPSRSAALPKRRPR